MSHHYSLRKRLLLAILGSSAVLWLAGIAIMLAVVWHVTNRTLDNALKEAGVLIIRATSDLHRRGVLPEPVMPELEQDDRRSLLQYQIIVGGQIRSRTEGAPARPFLPPAGQRGFANVRAEDRQWRVYAASSRTGSFQVQIGQRLEPRRAILLSLAGRLLLPALLWLIALAGVSRWLIRRVLRPLDQAAATMAAKSPHDLTPLAADGLPDELLPLTEALNRVLGRLDSALQSERRFTADAAHELRTPLAALRTQTQLLQRQHAPLAEPLQKLLTDIDRCASLVGHLLLLARLDPLNPADSGALQQTAVVLPELLTTAADACQTRAAEKAINIQVACDDGSLTANRELLDIALRNLLDNAVRYCPVGSEVLLRGRSTVNGVELGVYDNGPGVDHAQRDQLTRRFFRVLGSQQPGSGLGLSIVQRIAELCRAELIIGDGLDGRGLGVTLLFRS